MNRLLKFLALSQCDRTLFLTTFFLLAGIKLGLRLLPFPTLRQCLARFGTAMSAPQSHRPIPPDRTNLNRIIAAIHLSSRHMPGGAKCLARALTAQVLTRCCGYAPQLRLGVAKTASGQLEAHAWLEVQGEIAIGQLNDLDRFTPLPALEGGRS